MNKYFYTLGTSTQFPYKQGRVEIHASNLEKANQKFRSHFPDVNPGILNCAFVYDERQRNKMEPEKNWHDWKCYEIIEASYEEFCEYLKSQHSATTPFDINEDAIKEYKERQLAGVKMPCPRCGIDRMRLPTTYNCLSRQAEIYVCEACGAEEAILAMKGRPLPLKYWNLYARLI